jgi:hypothetical protein
VVPGNVHVLDALPHAQVNLVGESVQRERTSKTFGRALLAGITAGALNWALFAIGHGSDFYVFHFAARVWLSGGNPYAVGFPVMGTTQLHREPFYYPFPALVVMAPFALLPLRFAGALFVGISTTLLTFGLLGRRPECVPAFFGAGFLVAAAMGQWSVLVTATLLLPLLSWLAVVKPNLGLAVTVARPSALGIVGGCVFLLVTLALQPHWPAEWLRNLRSLPAHPPPVLVPGGALLLLALLKWRRPEARLLVAMACVPQLLYFADQLPLWLVAKTRREGMLLSATSLVAWVAGLVVAARASVQPALTSEAFVLVGVYLPVFVMILRRPNEGAALPLPLERIAARLPRWVRGSANSLEPSR